MYVFAIAFRLLRTRKMSWVATVIVSAIVFLYLLIIAVLEGFKAHYMDKIQSIKAHMTVHVGNYGGGIVYPEEWAAHLEKVAHVKGVSIGLQVPALVQFDNARTIGQLRGVDLERELQYGRLKEMLKPPELSSFGDHTDRRGRKLQGCIVGGYWRKEFGVKIGDLITFCFTEITGEEDPRASQFKVVGFFEGQSGYLENAAYVDRKQLAKMIGVEDQAKTLSVWVEGDADRRDLDQIRGAVRDAMKQVIEQDMKGHPNFAKRLAVETWREKDNNFYGAVTRENAIMRFIMAIFLFFSGFIIALILAQLVAEKTRDIGTLRALGATHRGILACFVFQGLLIAIIGLALGLPLAKVFVAYINEIEAGVSNFVALFGFENFHVFPVSDFLLPSIPTNLRNYDIMLITVLTLASGLLGAFIPALRAARRNPVECLRHE